MSSKPVDMKQDPAEQKKALNAEIGQPNKPSYPYGLELSLDSVTMKKLGISRPPAVGDKLEVTANATVSSVSSNVGQGTRMRIQITHLALDTPETEKVESRAARKLYGGSDPDHDGDSKKNDPDHDGG